MIELERRLRIGAALLGISLLAAGQSIGQTDATPKHSTGSTASTKEPIPGLFVDTATKSGLNFMGFAQHTPTKYLIETMGSGVAVFDFDNDGRLDIFMVNGASITDPSPRAQCPGRQDQRNGTGCTISAKMAPSRM
jgi:hypothetical protein